MRSYGNGMATGPRITDERETVEVDVMRERVRVSRRSVEPRLARPEEVEGAFVERTVRIPAFAEKVVARKELVKTGEVAIQKRPVIEPEPVEPIEPEVAEAVEPVEVAGVQVEPIEVADQDEAGMTAAVPEEAGEQAAPGERMRRWFEDVRTGWTRAREAARTE